MEGIFGSMIMLENIDTNNVGSVVRKHSADPFTKVHCHVKSMESSFLLALEYNIVDSEVTNWEHELEAMKHPKILKY